MECQYYNDIFEANSFRLSIAFIQITSGAQCIGENGCTGMVAVDFRYGHSNLLNMLMQRRTKIQIPMQLLLDNSPTEIGSVATGLGVSWNRVGCGWVWGSWRDGFCYVHPKYSALFHLHSCCFSEVLLRPLSIRFEKIIPHSWVSVPGCRCPGCPLLPCIFI